MKPVASLPQQVSSCRGRQSSTWSTASVNQQRVMARYGAVIAHGRKVIKNRANNKITKFIYSY